MSLKRSIKTVAVSGLCLTMMTIPASGMPLASDNGRPVSWVDNSRDTYERQTLMVDGKPFFFNGVQIRIDKVKDFYHYSDEEMRTKHTWQINTLGRDVIPIMNNIASLPGGHKPLNFTHILADGSLRHVQTYAGPVVLYNIRLMLCIIHDITEEVHLKKELEFSAAHDPLTGLLNRREFHRLVEAPTFIPRGYCLLLIDIDHFKSINDIHGHQKGDEVLLVLSRILETSVDREDKIYRWGGEEFLLFLPHSPIGRALILAEGIRQAVSEYQTLSVTVSIGVAEHHDGETVDQLFSRVDKALYAAKNDGRNRVTRMPFDSSERRRSRDGAA